MNKNLIIRIIACIIASWLIEFALMQDVKEIIGLNIFFSFIVLFGAIVCSILYYFGLLQKAFADFGKLEIKND